MSEGKENSSGIGPQGPVPKAVVGRLSFYLRELQHLMLGGVNRTSSTQLGKLLGFTDAQVRKDLAYFGQFGSPGIGYSCDKLIGKIREILGTNRPWPVVLVGVGNLGRALLGYRGFGTGGFRIVAAVDNNDDVVGQTFEGIKVQHSRDLPHVVKQHDVHLAILAIPSNAAQSVADQLVAAGIDGIMNFAPVTLNVRKDVRVQGVDLAIELEQLAYQVAKCGDGDKKSDVADSDA